MELTPDHARVLVTLLTKTQEHELYCDDCLCQLARFVEHKLAGQTFCEAMAQIQQHLDDCGECHEEYEMLRDALRAIGELHCPDQGK
jgi:hypothetical protein